LGTFLETYYGTKLKVLEVPLTIMFTYDMTLKDIMMEEHVVALHDVLTKLNEYSHGVLKVIRIGTDKRT
jgi:hypothetical protein